MHLQEGTRLGPYEVGASIGEGGMGEVYRGVDTRLGRAVAVKILPRHRAEREDARARFDREAKAVSQLNHQNICTLHDVGEATVDGTPVHYLVMELVEGETLADRIARGPIPLDQALKFGMQIAAALDCAHRRGIVHRDLKPGNVMIAASGVKLLDFGLAKTLQPPSSDSAAATVHGAITGDGAVVGTLQYIAPEQLSGGSADARSDIFALGAVLYEMVTGRRAFDGSTQASVIAAIIHDEPPRVSQLRPVLPLALDRIIAMCLMKDPEERWQNARDVLLQLRAVNEQPESRSRSSTHAVPLLTVAAAGLLLGAGGVWLASHDAAVKRVPPRHVSLDVAPPLPLLPNGFGVPFDIARDASKIAWVGSTSKTSALFVRRLDSLDARRVPGTEMPSAPFFSRDGDFIGFFASGHLRVASLRGDETVRDLAETGPGAGGSWMEDGTIVFASLPGSGLSWIAAKGGHAATLTTVDRGRGEGGHSWPFAIAGTRTVLFTVERDGRPWEEAQIAAVDVDTKQRRLVLDGGTHPRYAGGKLYFTRGNQLFSVALDPKTLAMSGVPSVVVDGVVSQPGTGGSFYAVAADGSIAYLHGSSTFFTTRVVMRENDGRTRVVDLPQRTFANPRLSHDGKQLALQVVAANDDVWVYHRDRGTFTRVTAQDENLFPNWSPDDREFLVSTFFHSGNLVASTVPIAGTLQPVPIAPQVSLVHIGTSWSRSGRIAITVLGGETGFDVYVVDSRGGRARPILQSRFNEHYATLSPDGRYVAYVSDASGDSEVYVRAVDQPAETLQLSVSGGGEPLWSRDGRVIYFRDARGFLAADVAPSGATVTAGTPRRLFDGDFVIGDEGNSYDVGPDGQFVLLQRNGAADDGTRLSLLLTR